MVKNHAVIKIFFFNKIKKNSEAIVIFIIAVGFLFQVLYFVKAGDLTNLKDELNRIAQNQTSGIIHTVVFTTENAVSGGVGANSVILIFPDNNDGTWCATAGTDLVVVGSTEDGATALPGTLTARCVKGVGALNYDTIFVEGVDNLAATTKYAVQISDGSTAKLGTPTATTTGVITVKTNNGVVDVDSEIFAVTIIANDQVSVTVTVPEASVSPPPEGGGGGSSGGGIIHSETEVIFIGKSSPFGLITVLKDGQVATTTRADENGNFQTRITDITGGIYLFSFLSENEEGELSKPLTFSVAVAQGTITTISGIFISSIMIIRGDLNRDGHVNIVDFSIMIYWQDKVNPPLGIDLNNDGKINIIDFSIMAYYWTG